MTFPVRGTIVAVYPLDDPKNHAHVAYCDIQLYGGYPMLTKVWVARAGFRQETFEAGPAAKRWRNATAPPEWNGTNGWAQSPMPGDLVVVQFLEGKLTQPFISHHWPASNQGRESDDHPHGGGYPFNQQERYRIKGSELVDEVVKRLDATKEHAPQWSWLYNGAFVEVLNDGSILIQSSDSQTPIVAKDRPDLGVAKSPDPTGSIVMSTRGAREGDFVVTTGEGKKQPESQAHGNVLFLVYKAKEGNCIANLSQAEEGNFIVQGSTQTPSQIFLRVKKEDDYLHVNDGLSELSAENEVVLRTQGLVSLGRRKAPRSAVTWEELTQVMAQLCFIYDTHTHPDLTPGETPSPPPTQHQGPYFEGAKTDFQSAVVKLERDHEQDDPKGPKVSIDRGMPSTGLPSTGSSGEGSSTPPAPRRPGTPGPYGVWQ